jgi:hypothetical protein
MFNEFDDWVARIAVNIENINLHNLQSLSTNNTSAQ